MQEEENYSIIHFCVIAEIFPYSKAKGVDFQYLSYQMMFLTVRYMYVVFGIGIAIWANFIMPYDSLLYICVTPEVTLPQYTQSMGYSHQ